MSLTSCTGQSLTRKGEATRARIVAAAADLMYRHGIAGTSIEEVRLAADVSSSQLYHYFVDKSALVRSVIRYQAEQVVDGQLRVLSTLDGFEGLQAWRDLIVDGQRRLYGMGGCVLGSLVGEVTEGDELARAELSAGFSQWVIALRRGLEAMQASGALRPEADTEQLARGTLAALEGGLLLTRAQRDVAPLEAGLDFAVAYIRTFAT